LTPLTNWAGAWFFPVRFRVISPTSILRQPLDLKNLASINPSFDENLISQWLIFGIRKSAGLGSRHFLMLFIISAHKNPLVVINAKIYTQNRFAIITF
jgi:hypothetical protein